MSEADADAILAPEIDRIYSLPEGDYRFGLGPIMARVVAVIRRVQFSGAPWWQVDANVAYGSPDHHGDFGHVRSLYIRETAIRLGPLP